ncbi:hypothetical protein IC607_14155 [Cellulomonas sp. JH27-2]|uniref:hypothetical protein n=1 Tax=Cellulomonas sp. JH27-2 TaxID=2774139 RepID=UPI00178131A8|nr:hypothetical protein [Cellulomonas sp. JH27-2]MBD8060113.1 hypothetical protein [Cellulomonas sp. JH27-2]
MKRTIVVAAGAVLAGCAAWALGSVESVGVERSFPPAPTATSDTTAIVLEFLRTRCTGPEHREEPVCTQDPLQYAEPMDALHERVWELENQPGR